MHKDYDKMTKKEKKAYNNSKRGSWYGVNPITRVNKSYLKYKKKKAMLKGTD